MTNATSSTLLDIRGLKTVFHTDAGVVRAVDGVDFRIEEGETVGIVGESGCGKSVMALSVMQLVPDPPGEIVEGEVLWQGRDLLQLSRSEMRRVRGAEIGMIFQEPMTSLNPVLTVGHQIVEPLQQHEDMTGRHATRRATELLELAGMPDAEARLRDYPHMLSGGQRQRVMIAIALSCNPKLLIADEATTALDVTIQAQILELMRGLTERFGTALMLITHNLGVVARYADRVSVMYAGRIRETASAERVYSAPRHPYTLGLLGSVPRLDARRDGGKLVQISGDVPDPLNLPSGCAFRTRCGYATERCAEEDPGLTEVESGHAAACWEWDKINGADG